MKSKKTATKPESRTYFVTQKEYDLIQAEPDGVKIKPDRLAQIVGQSRMLRMMHDGMHGIQVFVKAEPS